MPPAVINILENYGPERFTAVFTGEFDTPEVIWGGELRKQIVDMINQHIIPSVKKAAIVESGKTITELESAVATLKSAIADIHHTEDTFEQAKLARVLRLETMIEIRETCDAVEAIIPAELWTLATYKDLLFLDSHM